MLFGCSYVGHGKRLNAAVSVINSEFAISSRTGDGNVTLPLELCLLPDLLALSSLDGDGSPASSDFFLDLEVILNDDVERYRYQVVVCYFFIFFSTVVVCRSM